MDLTLPVSGFILNLRATVLLETPDGFVFEHDPKADFYCPVGGRIKIGETSMESAKRELYEELGVAVDALKFSTILENFFTYDGDPYHEINMLYTARAERVEVPEGFKTIKREDLAAYDIKPQCVKTMLQSGETISHIINSEV